jgi:tetratricopeptide (TPR) repeat protein/mono/diheme cytochrome c family protein
MYKQVTGLFVGGVLLPVASASAQVTFNRDIAPILYSHCTQCHQPGGSAPFSLLTYSDVRPHATQVGLLTKNRLMPPWKAESERGEFIGLDPLSDAEIDAIQRWVSEGAPRGDPRDLPPAPVRISGWQLGQPDLTVMFPEPFILPAEGPDLSRVFVLPLPVDRVRYVRGIEFRAGNARIHHANIRIDATAASRQLDQQEAGPGYDGVILRSAVYPDGHFLGWTPGQIAPLLPKGLAWRLAPTSDLVVQLHMVPSGKPETIQPSIALYFADDPPERTPVMMRLSIQNIDIPAGEKNYTITDSFVLPVDVEVHALQPHAHYLAREVSGFATLPDGSTRTLIRIKDWDLRWQHVYRYVDPLPLPKGTTVTMRYTYDNSAENPRNPARPPARVAWGQQSREEMGDFWLQVMPKNESDRRLLDTTFRAKWMATDAIGLEALIRRDPSNTQLRDDVAVLYMELNRPSEAVPHFEANAAMKPDVAAAHFNLGTALTAVGRVDEAIVQYQEALRLRPAYGRAHNNLGTALLQRGRAKEALEHFVEATRVDPRLDEAHVNVGLMLRAMGNFAGAMERFREAVRLSPDSVPAIAGLASLLAVAPDGASRNVPEAIRLGEHAAELTGRRDANVLDVVAAAYAAAGRFDRAIAISQEALELDPAAPLATLIRDHQELYRRGQPYVSPR